MIRLGREGAVFVLRWDAGENRFADGAVAAWSDALDEVDRAESPKALVTTGSGKFYSNGLDLDFMLREDGRPPQTAHEVITTGRRNGGAEARAAGIVEHAVPEAEVLPRALALALADALAPKAHPVMSRLKAGLYPGVLAALRAPLPEAG